MKYMGSKNRFAQEIVDVILEREYKPKETFYFLEPFCGGLHISQKLIETIKSKKGDVISLASDANVFLTALWKVIQQQGIDVFPREISKEFYSEKRTLFKKIS